MNLRAVAAAAVLTLIICGSAAAQGPGKQKGQKKDRGARVAQIAQLNPAALDALVKLTSEQKTKVTSIYDKFQADTRALPKDPSSRTKRRDLARTASQDVMALLTDEQKSKLQNTMREVGPLAGAGIPIPLLADLKLTDEQQKKIVALVAESRKRGAAGPVDKKAARLELHKKVQEILTADQKSIVARYLAEHPQGRKKKKKV